MGKKSQSICLCEHSRKLHDIDLVCMVASCDCENFTPESDYGDKQHAAEEEPEERYSNDR